MLAGVLGVAFLTERSLGGIAISHQAHPLGAGASHAAPSSADSKHARRRRKVCLAQLLDGRALLRFDALSCSTGSLYCALMHLAARRARCIAL